MAVVSRVGVGGGLVWTWKAKLTASTSGRGSTIELVASWQLDSPACLQVGTGWCAPQEQGVVGAGGGEAEGVRRPPFPVAGQVLDGLPRQRHRHRSVSLLSLFPLF
jgi:hypothetical protein